MRVTERYKRVDFGHIQFQVAFDDPQTLTRPLIISLKVDYAADTDMLEDECNENNRDVGHLADHETAAVKLSPAVLARYAGTYEFREGGAGTFFPRTQTMSLVNGQLFMNALPLIPQSETTFETETGAGGSRADILIAFVMDSGGQVTHLVLTAAGGDNRYDRKR